MTAGSRASAGKRTRIPPAEWVVAAVSALIALGAVGYLTVRATRPGTLPALTAAVDSVVHRDQGAWQVRVRVENHGDGTAATVQVEGVLGDDGERSGFTLDFVAGGSTRHGTLLFATDPSTVPLALRVLGYADP